MKTIGKGVMSGKDVCLLEHLKRLMTEGHSCFRVEAATESPAYRLEIGRVYREALEAALAGRDGEEDRWWDTIRRHARIGPCNGFYFGTSGMAYHGVRHPGADTAEDQRSGAGQ
jgi:putative protease